MRDVVALVGATRGEQPLIVGVACVYRRRPGHPPRRNLAFERERGPVGFRLAFVRVDDAADTSRNRDEIRPLGIEVHLTGVVVAVAVQIAPGPRDVPAPVLIESPTSPSRIWLKRP